MSLTIAQYKTKLTTHATTAGAGFLYGYFDEINSKLRDETLASPFLVVEPTQYPLAIRGRGATISFKCNAYATQTTDRETSFDAIITVINAFIAAINTDASLLMLPPETSGTLVDFGSVVENYYVVSFETTIDIIC